MRRQTNPETAFTLTEVLISLFVLSVGILGIMSLFPVGLDATTRTLDSTNASVLVQSALAELQYRQEVMEDFETNASDVWFNPAANQSFRFTGKPSYSWNAVFAVPDTRKYFTVGGAATYGIALVQIAVYRDHDTAKFITGSTTTPGSTATFTDGSAQVTFSEDLSAQVRPGFYIRQDPTGFWYRITGTSTNAHTTATLDREFSNPHAIVGTDFTCTNPNPHTIVGAAFTCTNQVVALEATYLAKH